MIWIEASRLYPFPDCLAGLLKPTGKKKQIFYQGNTPSHFGTSCHPLNSDFTKNLLLQKYYFGVVEYHKIFASKLMM